MEKEIIGKLISSIIGPIMFIIGCLGLWRPFIEWSIKINNIMRGTKTQIEKGTIIYTRVASIVLIIFSIFWMYIIFTKI